MSRQTKTKGRAVGDDPASQLALPGRALENMKRLTTILLLSAFVASAQSLMPPAAPKHYHGVKIVKGATLLKTKLTVPKPPPMVLLTCVSNPTTNTVTCIEASPDLRNWTLVFTGATNQCRQPATNSATFWRAYTAPR